jgi:hypothetical protein
MPLPPSDAEATPAIDWVRLSEVPDLVSFLEPEAEGFTGEVKKAFAQWRALPDDELEGIAQLRALEVTNGCVQWAFRRQVEGHLEVQPTRECMKTVMGFMLSKEIHWPDGDVVKFSAEVRLRLDSMRQLYIEAFKHGDQAAARDFYAQSAGQFLALGRERMQRAFVRVSDQFGDLFTEAFLERGRRYAQRFLIPLRERPSEGPGDLQAEAHSF